MKIKNPGRSVTAVLLLLFILSAVLLLNNNCVYTPDSAEYVILAEAIFSGQGFRDLSEPDRPLHVKHPFIYPLLLALPVGLFPAHPILVAKLAGIVLAAGGILLFFSRLRRRTGPRPALALAAALAFNPLYLLFAVEPMAETAFLTLSLAALTLLSIAARSDRLLPAVAAGLLIAAAALTRTIGVALIPAALLFFVLRREWRKGLVAAGVALACVAAWAGRDHYLERRGEEIMYESYGRQFFSSELNPLADGFTLAGFPPRIYHNAVFYFRAGPYLAAPPIYLYETGLAGWVNFPILLRLQGAGWLKAILRLAFYLLLVPGFILALADPEERPAGFYAAAYILLLLIFPFREYRLIFPLLPFALLFLARGFGFYRRRLKISRPGLGYLLLAAGVVSYLAVDLTMIASNLSRRGVYREQARGRWYRYPHQAYDWEGAGEWLRENTQPDDLVVGGRKELYLLSRRRMVFEGQYGAVLGGFRQALEHPGARYLVSETSSGLPAAHRMMANAVEYDFEPVKKLAGVDIYRIRRFPGRTREVPPPDYTGPIRLARRRAEEFPYSFEAHNELGYFHFKNRDYPAAIRSFRSALALHPDAGMTRFNLAAAYLDSGRPEPALRELRRSLTMPHADLLLDLVRVNMEIAKLLKVVEREPMARNNFPRLLEIAGLYYSQQEYRMALDYIDRALALNPASPDAYFFRGMTLEARGQSGEAAEAYRQVVKLAPDHPEALGRLRELEPASILRLRQ